jgi:23S rRNA G2445 N2-methylase RlmL
VDNEQEQPILSLELLEECINELPTCRITLIVNKVFAITTRGLEPVSADELAALPGVTVEQVAYRRVVASCKASLAPLLGLRTVEDVFLYVDTWSAIGRARGALQTLTTLSAQLPLDRIARICAQVRSIPQAPVFSVTANFVGRRNYSTNEIKKACAEGVISRQGWTYSEDDGTASVNLRIFIEGENAIVGIRLAEHSLSKRPYKHSHIPGSLKPTVAAALASLVGLRPGMQVLDPCCGAGTILIEAQAHQAEVWGGDIDLRAVMAARENAAEAGAPVRLQCWDALSLPVADHSMDRVISNLPWGRAVRTMGTLSALYAGIGQEIKRVLAPGGQVALLTNQPELMQIPGMRCERRIEISLFGQTPSILIWRHDISE